MRTRAFGPGWIDGLVIAACGLVFTVALVSHHRAPPPPGPPTEQAIEQLAAELGVPADRLRRATEIVPPPIRGERPSPEQRDKARQMFAAALDIPVEQLDSVMRHHHPRPRD